MAEKINNVAYSMTKGVKAFLLALGTFIAVSIGQALLNFHPEPGTQSIIWTAVGSTIIGLFTGLGNWLKNKNTTTTVTQQGPLIVTTSSKPANPDHEVA